MTRWTERDAIRDIERALRRTVRGPVSAARPDRVRSRARGDGRRSGPVRLGIGDDAAVIAAGRGDVVLSVDVAVEGVHFDRRWLSWTDVGYRAYQAAISDLAAMGAMPRVALSSLILPPSFERRWLVQLSKGQAQAAAEHDCPLVGGNVSRGSEVSVTTTVVGQAEQWVARGGARAGDELWLVGDVGLARAGYLLLAGGSMSRSRAADVCRRAWRRPFARLSEGRRLVGKASSVIDLSDGLGGDAAKLAEASAARIVIERGRLLAALSDDLSSVCRAEGWDATQVALVGGEDYALLATGPSRRRPRFARCIGRIERGRGAILETETGGEQRLDTGFDHFAER